jgi:hypothetical protein
VTFKKIQVSKLDAARRQLDTAIDLWFHDGDPVSIHTLVFAAYEIIQDINKKKGNVDATLLGLIQRNVKSEHVEEVMKKMKKPMTFFKHADRDPYGILEFQPELSESFLYLAIIGFGELGEQTSNLVKVFVLWGSVHKPHLFLKDDNPIASNLSAVQIENVRQLNKRGFLEACMEGLAQVKIKC